MKFFNVYNFNLVLKYFFSFSLLILVSCQFDIKVLNSKNKDLGLTDNGIVDPNQNSEQNLYIESLEASLKTKVTGYPKVLDSSNNLDILVSGENITHYKYKLGLLNSTDCNNWSNYSTGKLSLSSKISDTLDNYLNGSELKLCAIGIRENLIQNLNSATELTWIKDTPAFVDISTLGQSIIEKALPMSFSISLSQVKPYDVTVYYRVSGTATGIDHNLNSGAALISAGNSSATVFYNILKNPLMNPEKSFIVTITHTSKPGVVPGPNSTLYHSLRDEESVPFSTVTSIPNQFRNHFCLIKSNKKLYCWGANTTGAVGNGFSGTTLVHYPYLVDSSNNYIKVSMGALSRHTCGLTEGNQLKCWGSNSNGQIGDNSTIQRNSPVLIDSPVLYSELSTGGLHSCGITTLGALKCWGSNAFGQLGDGTTTQRNTPTTIDSGILYSQVSVGLRHTCAITQSGVLKCWGNNGYGQVGNGSSVAQLSPTVIDTGVTYHYLSAGEYNTCGITDSGALKCWGNNGSNGLLGDGATSIRLTPTLIDGGTNYKKVSLSETHSCGLTQSNLIKCWGGNSAGNLGDGKNIRSLIPKLIDSGVSYLSVSAGSSATCGLSMDGDLRCWGSNGSGIHADGKGSSMYNGQLPTVINENELFKDIATPNVGACALTSNGQIKCWGSNTNGYLGIGIPDVPIISPTPIPTPPGRGPYLQLASSNGNAGKHFCAIDSLNNLYCWGENGNGQIGNGTSNTMISPTLIDQGTTYSQISVGSSYTCGITTTGDLKCWGYNYLGKLGDNTTISKNTPTLIDSPNKYSKISSGNGHTCGITIHNELKCWGGSNSYGQLGNGTLVGSLIPITIDSGVGYKEISAGYLHTCGITITNALKCWGRNYYWSVGDGTQIDRTSPVLIDSGVNYLSVATSTSSESSCGITSSNDLKCWGLNWDGELGYGPTPDHQALPFLTDTGTKYQRISMSASRACGITLGGQLKCWGENSMNILGLNSLNYWIPKVVLGISDL